ncbi:ATP-dependent nuclease [Actinocatenispora rupis]|uniref:ATPase n=1 Tax=Actinocatenispora rupis TaxID=519421 RepID=A0A8J3J9D9_9ACTN|nr:AAA family ATPase [Actinocatenispora rupis]GID14101.1 ATPase [Actinocatenispora rupis]
MNSTLDAIASMLAAGKFEPFIRHIRFPHYRNLREGTRVEFLHPVTALVGPNGTNKTAILRALQGAPEGANLGQYWFSTNVDRILAEDRHRFIYGYLAGSIHEIVEVVKSRIVREGDPDYWETARPLASDEMAPMPRVERGALMPPERNRTRWKSIRKPVVYLDFRSELSAYDKFFFHVPYHGAQNLTEKKKFIRRRSRHLRSVLDGGTSKSLYRRERILAPAFTLSKQDTKVVSSIVGKQYRRIRIVRHDLFDVRGATVVLDTPDLRYSEAFAGSGEFAVVMMVRAISEAEPGSLILLDEPEVSLHPGAQGKLMDFIAASAKASQHQFVISTHAPEIIRNLPPQAIKVFVPNEKDGKIDLIAQEADPADAFFRLGLHAGDKWTVYVEDRLAMAVVKRAARKLGKAANSRLDVRVLPGGAEAIKGRLIPTLALTNQPRCLVLLDGDQRPKCPQVDPSGLVDGDLESALTELMRCKILLMLDGAAGHSAPGQEATQRRCVLDWCFKHLRFLPHTTPEALILLMEGRPGASGAQPGKETWLTRTRQALGREDWESVTGQEILYEQERALAKVNEDCDELVQVRDVISNFLAVTNHA